MAKHDSLIGTVVGNYEVQRELGRGGMGVVYKANEMSLQRVVALKVLPSHLAADEEFVKRFEREARASARLNHPNIVTVYAVGEHEGMHFMAMEYVKGKTIATMTKEKGRFEAREALEIVAQAADALGEAHDHDIIHRDIKPQNVMVDRVGRVKVMDFGLAKVLSGMSALTATGAAMGTPTYMAPEQCKGEAIDPRTDIYALGVMLFEMLTGRPPYVGDTPMAVISQIMMAPFPSITELNPDVPAAVVHIISKMTAKDPVDRYPSGQVLLGDIKRWRRTGEVSAPGDDEATTPLGEEATLPLTPTTPAATAEQPSESTDDISQVETVTTPVSGAVPKRSSRVAMAVGALLLCALIAAGGVLVWRNMGADPGGAEPATQTAAVPETTEHAPPEPSGTPEEPPAQGAASSDADVADEPVNPSEAVAAVSSEEPQNTTEDGGEAPASATEPPAQIDDQTEAPSEKPTLTEATPDGAEEAAVTAPEETTPPADEPAQEPAPMESPPEGGTPAASDAIENTADDPGEAPAAEEDAAPSEPAAAETQLAAAPKETVAPPPKQEPTPPPQEQPSGPKEYAGGRFIDRGDGTVLDDETLLLWQKADSGKALGTPRPGRSSDYRHYADQLDLAGRAWRIPTKAEFMSLQVDEFGPSDLPFRNSGDGGYWCFGSGPNAMYWVFDWNNASFGVTTPDMNPKFTVRCVAGP